MRKLYRLKTALVLIAFGLLVATLKFHHQFCNCNTKKKSDNIKYHLFTMLPEGDSNVEQRKIPSPHFHLWEKRKQENKFLLSRYSVSKKNVQRDKGGGISNGDYQQTASDFASRNPFSIEEKRHVVEAAKFSTHSTLHYPEEPFSCEDVRELLTRAAGIKGRKHRAQTDEGNKSVYFVTTSLPNGDSVNVVVKKATLPDIRLPGHYYRYNAAIREIINLRKLRDLNWKGVPRLLGSCITSTKVVYVISKVEGVPLCRGLGFEESCAVAKDLIEYINKTPDPGLSTLIWLSKAICFFKQFEIDNVFMEDLSGSNLHYIPQTFELFLVDADSLIFYGNVSMNSRSSCKDDDNCPIPKGNLWEKTSLNHQIYSLCKEMKGHCVDNICRGFDSSLHTCGIAIWLVNSVFKTVPPQSNDAYEDALSCMYQHLPENRCSLVDVCNKITAELIAYRRTN